MQNPFVFWIDGDELFKFRLNYFLAKYYPGVPAVLALQNYVNDRNVPRFRLAIRDAIELKFPDAQINGTDLALGMNFYSEVPFIAKFNVSNNYITVFNYNTWKD